MTRPTDRLLVRRLSDSDSLLEVGIGDRPGVAAGLVRAGADVRTTDVHPVEIPEGVRFRLEDVTAVDTIEPFHQVETVYALNCPPELHQPIRELAERVDATFCFTTLGLDQPEIPVDRETLLAEHDPTAGTVRVTLYVAKLDAPTGRGPP